MSVLPPSPVSHWIDEPIHPNSGEHLSQTRGCVTGPLGEKEADSMDDSHVLCLGRRP